MNILLLSISTALFVTVVNGHNIETTSTRCDQVTCTLSEVCNVYEVVSFHFLKFRARFLKITVLFYFQYDMSCLCPNGQPQRALGEDYVDSNGQKFPGPNICSETCTETVVRAVCDPIGQFNKNFIYLLFFKLCFSDRPCSTHAATCSSDQLCIDTKLKTHHCTNNWVF